MPRLFDQAVPYNPFVLSFLFMTGALAVGPPTEHRHLANPRFRGKNKVATKAPSVRPGRRRAYNRMM